MPSAKVRIASHPNATVSSEDVLYEILAPWLRDRLHADENSMMYACRRLHCADMLRAFLAEICENEQELLKAAEKAISTELRARFMTERAWLLASQGDTSYNMRGLKQLRRSLRDWSKVKGLDVFRIFFASDLSEQDAEHMMGVLRMCLTPHSLWQLLIPHLSMWPITRESFDQQVTDMKAVFNWHCLGAVGRPLPLGEIGEMFASDDYSLLQDVIRDSLQPAEIAYALSKGALLLDQHPNGMPASAANKPVLRLNPLLFKKL